MKIRNIISLAMLLVIFAAGCSDNHDYSGVIATAMQSRQQAYEDASTVSHESDGRTIVQVSLKNFAVAMRKIDVSGCPRDFRTAWSTYLDKVDATVKKSDSYGYVDLGRGRVVNWSIPLDHNGVDFEFVWSPLSDAVDQHKAPPKPPGT